MRARTATSAVATRQARPSVSREWLGLDDNSSSAYGHLNQFSRFGIVYDRLGSLASAAGETVSGSPVLAQGLRTSIAARMVPDIMISPVRGPQGCATDPNGSQLCLPEDRADIGTYVGAFIKTVKSIRRAYPRRRIIFEPMNEPWDWVSPPGTASGVHAATRYAAILAQLLPALKAAGVPLSLIYVPATGKLSDSSYWIPDLYRAQRCLEPGPGSCGPIKGWNFHPYGPAASTNAGIAEVPRLRRAMRSGENNIIISEIGFCANDVLGGAQCDENTPTVVGSSSQTTRWLTAVLYSARRMHQAGWLRALLIWQRAGGGWSMQLSNGRLTAEGRALIRFARASGR